jgi:site-specific DNA recombinase
MEVTKESHTSEISTGVSEFDAVWAALTPKEQARVLALLIERVDYDGKSGNVAITFHPTGIKTLASEVSEPEETAA